MGGYLQDLVCCIFDCIYSSLCVYSVDLAGSKNEKVLFFQTRISHAKYIRFSYLLIDNTATAAS